MTLYGLLKIMIMPEGTTGLKYPYLFVLIRDGGVANRDEVRPVVEGDPKVKIGAEQLDGFPGDHPRGCMKHDGGDECLS